MNGFAWNKKLFARATGDDLEIQQVYALTGKALSRYARRIYMKYA